MQATTPTYPRFLLPMIVIGQFAGTALWFAGNAVMPELQVRYQMAESTLGYLTSAVQLGFIAGTLLFAFLLIADRFRPSRVFMWCALLGAAINAMVLLPQTGLWSILLTRFLTGLCLAGIYPVGMKIAADWYQDGLGKALGYLVGALVLGTAFPHLVRSSVGSLGMEPVILTTSIAAGLGGLLVGFGVPEGPFRKKGARFDPRVIRRMFAFRDFRAAAFGYFGHMWELYAFWAFTPVFLRAYFEERGLTFSVSAWSFFVIAAGALGCVWGGYVSLRRGSARVAFSMLLTSGILCLLSPLLFSFLPPLLLLAAMLLWGFTVVGDSPQFSTLVARTAPADYVGSALTLVNCLGFSITILSIQLLAWVQVQASIFWLFLPLILGPVMGLSAIRKLVFN